MPHDRDVGGIRCLEVLSSLPSFLDGDASPSLRARITAHIQGCAWCEQLGGSYADTLQRLRAILPDTPDTPPHDPSTPSARIDRLLSTLPFSSPPKE